MIRTVAKTDIFFSSLWGVTCVQTWTYFTRTSNERDAVHFRLLIGFLWALDTFDSVLDVHIIYHYMVTNFMNLGAILSPTWSILIHILMTSFTNFIVRCLFIRRVYRLSYSNYLLCGWLIALSLLEFATGIAIVTKAFSLGTFNEIIGSISALFYLDFAANIVGDGSVALALCYYLVKRKTVFDHTNKIIRTFVVYTVNTGVLVALDATIGMVLYSAMPHNLIFLAFYLLLSKLYLNSYLASINARDHIREHSEGPLSIHLSRITDSRFDSPRDTGADRGRPVSALVVASDTSSQPAEKTKGMDHSSTDEEQGLRPSPRAYPKTLGYAR
jgi:hypothetical protein